jgi:hypothetical protein
VLRIDGMVKLMLEQYGVSYLPLESVSMQERVRAVEFVLARCGLSVAEGRVATRRPRSVTVPPKPTIDSWPHALVNGGDQQA